jgi:hypothetical protein
MSDCARRNRVSYTSDVRSSMASGEDFQGEELLEDLLYVIRGYSEVWIH